MSRIDAAGLAAQSGSGPNWMGTKKTVMEFFPPVESGSPGANVDTMEADETIGSRFPTDREIGGVFYEPELQGKVRASWLPRLLSGFMGDPVTTVVLADTVWNHTFEPTNALAIPRAMSILMHRGDPSPAITDLFWDALGNDLTLTCETGDWLSFDGKWVARAVDETQPAPVVVQDLTRKFPFYTMSAFVSIAGGAEAPIALSKFESAWSGNIDTSALQLGSRELYRVAPGNVDCEVTFTPLQDLADYYRRAFLTEPESVKLRLLAQGPIISGVHRQEVELTLHRLIETDAGADIDAGSTMLGVDVTAQASLDPVTGKFYTVRVKNAVEDYVVV